MRVGRCISLRHGAYWQKDLGSGTQHVAVFENMIIKMMSPTRPNRLEVTVAITAQANFTKPLLSNILISKMRWVPFKTPGVSCSCFKHSFKRKVQPGSSQRAHTSSEGACTLWCSDTVRLLSQAIIGHLWTCFTLLCRTTVLELQLIVEFSSAQSLHSPTQSNSRF